MAVAATPEVPEALGEQRMLLHASWDEYVTMRELLDRPGLKMTFIEGALELMSPSREHELWKKSIARLIELFAHLNRIPLHGYGSTTFKKQALELGAEPDECYLVGQQLVEFPHIVLEVIHSSPLLDKLRVYLGFGVPEVWVFRNGRFALHGLARDPARYVPLERSALLPAIDFAMIARYAVRPDQAQALWDFEAEIRRT